MERLVIAMASTSGGTKSRRAKDFFLSILDDDVILLVGGMVRISNQASTYLSLSLKCYFYSSLSENEMSLGEIGDDVPLFASQ